MTVIITTCRTCGLGFEPDRAAILAGVWRVCPDCRGVGDPTPKSPTVCPICRRVLKSGKHRGPCPGRRRRSIGDRLENRP